MPKLSDAHHKLEKLIGKWKGEEKIQPSPWDPNGGAAIGKVDNRSALDGFVVVQDYEQVRNGATSFRGHGVFSWDPMQKAYLMHWFDSMGTSGSVFQGNFEGNVLTLTSKGPQGHNRAVFDVSEANRYRFRMDVSPDGKQWFPFMEGNYTKGS